MKLEGKIAVITGGAAGIGKAIAVALANEGADVAVADLQIEKAEAVTAQLKTLGRRSLALQCDVGDSAHVDRMIQQVRDQLGGLHILVNNAAVIAPGLFWTVTDDAWDRIIRNNLSSVFYCARAAAKIMIDQKQGGRIIN